MKRNEALGSDGALSMPIKGTPYAHQQAAFRFICDEFGLTGKAKVSTGCALLMEMGCGKSLVGVAVIGELWNRDMIRRVLIVCPLSITGVWKSEIEKFADYPCRVTLLTGTASKKREQLEAADSDGLEIVVINYESMWRFEEELRDWSADMIIADEGHRLKDGTSRQSKAMHRLGDRAEWRLLLTGTAITNRELDIYSEYRFCAPQVFGKGFYSFRAHYFFMGGYGGYVPQFRKDRLPEFLEKLHSVAFRVRKVECLDLPEVTEEIRDIPLEKAAFELYEDIRNDSYAVLKNSEVTSFNILTQLLRLSQITGGHLTDDNGKTYPVSQAKMKALEDIIETMQAEERKLVIMARFRAELDDIEDLLRKKKIRYAVVRGGVKDREEQVRAFQEDADCTVFLGQIQAAGMGLTLTAASTMVFYSLDYNMASFDQAKARIHRVSQTQNCHYIYLCCRATIDYKVLKALQDKIDLAKALVDDWRKGKNPFEDNDWNEEQEDTIHG